MSHTDLERFNLIKIDTRIHSRRESTCNDQKIDSALLTLLSSPMAEGEQVCKVDLHQVKAMETVVGKLRKAEQYVPVFILSAVP